MKTCILFYTSLYSLKIKTAIALTVFTQISYITNTKCCKTDLVFCLLGLAYIWVTMLG